MSDAESIAAAALDRIDDQVTNHFPRPDVTLTYEELSAIMQTCYGAGVEDATLAAIRSVVGP